MNSKKLTILGIIAVVMVVWAVFQSRMANREVTVTAEQTYLIQGLDPGIIDRIELGQGENQVVLQKGSNGFVLKSKDDYPAKNSQISDLITKCLDIKTLELVTEDPQNHEDLEVTEEKARGLVKFLDDQGQTIVGVALGKYKEKGQGTYVRLLPGNKVFMTADSVWLQTQAINYVKQELLNVKQDQIETVKLSGPESTYALKKEGENVVLDGVSVPEGKAVKSGDASSVFNALSSLRFEDVKSEKKIEGLSFDYTYTCTLKDTTVYTLRLAKQDEACYLKASAEFMDTAPVVKEQEVESEQELKKKEAKLLAMDSAEQFTTDHKGWVYTISSWKADYLTKALDDLMEDEQDEPAAEENSTQ